MHFKYNYFYVMDVILLFLWLEYYSNLFNILSKNGTMIS